MRVRSSSTSCREEGPVRFRSTALALQCAHAARHAVSGTRAPPQHGPRMSVRSRSTSCSMMGPARFRSTAHACRRPHAAVMQEWHQCAPAARPTHVSALREHVMPSTTVKNTFTLARLVERRFSPWPNPCPMIFAARHARRQCPQSIVHSTELVEG